MNAKKILSIFGLVIFTVGCETNPPAPPIVATPVDDTAQAKLAEAAASVSQSFEELASIEKASTKVRIAPSPDPRSIGMSKLVSVDWNGPVEPLIRKIAAASNYTVKIFGRRPAIPALVSISAQNTPIADVLKDASFQVQRKATVVLYPRSRVIEIRYLGT